MTVTIVFSVSCLALFFLLPSMAMPSYCCSFYYPRNALQCQLCCPVVLSCICLPNASSCQITILSVSQCTNTCLTFHTKKTANARATCLRANTKQEPSFFADQSRQPTQGNRKMTEKSRSGSIGQLHKNQKPNVLGKSRFQCTERSEKQDKDLSKQINKKTNV